LSKNGLGYILGDFFANESGHPGCEYVCEAINVRLKNVARKIFKKKKEQSFTISRITMSTALKSWLPHQCG
jgi:hypothetical protein